MTDTITHRPPPAPATAAAARDGFVQTLRAEWTKLRSLRSTAIIAIMTMLFTAGISLLAVSSSSTESGGSGGPLINDRFHFVHQPLTGDGTVVAEVRAQVDSHELAKAGVMIKASTTPGSPYAAVMTTPRHGVRWQANFGADVVGITGAAPRWLRLTRSGNSVTGYESADGRTWSQVGTARLALPATAQVGLFVTSPGAFRVVERGNTTIAGNDETIGQATFANVSVTPVAPRRPGPPARWSDLDVGGVPPADQIPPGFTPAVPGSSTESGGVFTITGSGDIGPIQRGRGEDDIVGTSLTGIELGMITIIVLGVLFATSEYKTGMVRTTFAANPRRVRVFAAKAVVLGVAAFLVGLVACVTAFQFAQPTLRDNGYRPPSYPYLSLTDGHVVRAVVGSALFLAVLAVFSLGVATILRRTASTIILIVALVLVPQIIAPTLSLDVERWISRLTPLAGLAIRQTIERYDTPIGPWAGFGVLCGYAAVAMAVAFLLLRRRDA